MRLSVIIVVLLIAADISLAMYHYTFNKRHIPSPLAEYAPYLKISFVPLMTLFWHLISPTHPIWIYLYGFFAWGGDTLLLSSDFAIYKYGGISFFLSHVMMIIHLKIKWSRVPLYAYSMMIPGMVYINIFLIPQLVDVSLKAFCFVSYALILVIGSCHAIARVSYLPFKNASYLCLIFGYWFYLISDSMLLKREKLGVTVNLDVEVMSTYFIAQILNYVGVAIDPREKALKESKKD